MCEKKKGGCFIFDFLDFFFFGKWGILRIFENRNESKNQKKEFYFFLRPCKVPK